MDIGTATSGWQGGAWDVVARLAAADGSRTHDWFRYLTTPGAQQRDLADAVHSLCTLHGHHPGIADDAYGHRALPPAEDWLADAADGFAGERGYIARLTAASGPLPSTPGHAETHAAIVAQRHALAMLAGSDRKGCAMGAVAALMIDWAAIRDLLANAARRFGIEPSGTGLPHEAATATIVAEVSTSPGIERAIGFGAQQLLAQHRGLWSLLEARASARG